MCLNESITKQFMLAQNYVGPVGHLRILLRHTGLLFQNVNVNFMQHRSTGNIVQFPFEPNPNFLLAGETLRSFDKALQMKHCMHV